MKLLTQICRVLVGALFIFSGWIKANDPLGFSYKLDEYFEVFGTEFMIPFSLFLSIFICICEMVIGVMLLIGAKTKLTIWALLLMMIYFTFLTFYSAYFDKVKECGCFGDFIHLTAWQSFYKDVVLIVLIVILFVGQKNIRPLFGKGIEKILLILALILSTAFPLYTYNYLPVKDFRAYAIGKNIQEGMILPTGAKRDSVAMVFIYEKDGQKVEMSYDDVMKGKADATYKYVDRIDKLIVEGDKPAIQDFSITGLDGTNYTEAILNQEGYCLFIVCYDLNKTNKDAVAKLNDLTRLCQANKISVYGLTATADKIDSFKKETNAEFDFYMTDGTILKTMIRANPGLMLLKKGTVIDMWHYHSLPSFSQLNQTYFSK